MVEDIIKLINVTNQAEFCARNNGRNLNKTKTAENWVFINFWLTEA